MIHNRWMDCIVLLVIIIIVADAAAAERQQEEQEDIILTAHLQNRHLLMIGDSLMRYQYLSLAYLLRHHKYVSANTKPNLLLEKTWGTWQQFLQLTNKLLAPNEFCDCFKAEKGELTQIFNRFYNDDKDLFRKEHKDSQNTYENRYYRDYPIRNISMTWFSYIGKHFVLQGRWLPRDGESNNSILRQPATFFDPPRWGYHLPEFLSHVAAYLEPRPFLLVLNSGFWPHNFDNVHFALQVARQALLVADRVMWKTTNCARTFARDIRAADKLMCSFPSIECFNLSWTCNLSREDYWDELHFLPDVYRRVNHQFLTMIKEKDDETDVVRSRNFVGQADLGKLVVDREDHRYYFADTDSGFLIEFVGGDKNACMKAFDTKGRLELSSKELNKYFLGPPLTDDSFCRDGTMLRDSKGIFSVVDKGVRRPFLTPQAVMRHGFGSKVKDALTDDQWIHVIRVGPAIS